jgi:hypothetical protein
MRRLLVSGLIYQIHYNTQYGDGGNTSADLIANAKGQEGNFLKVSINPEKKSSISTATAASLSP